MQNSIEAGALVIRVTIHEADERLRVTVVDDGAGMDEATRQRALDPFYSDGVKHPTRRVGLGLPFLRQMVETTGGDFELESAPGSGTTVAFSFATAHVDAPPTGGLVEVIQQLLCFEGKYELIVDRRRDGDGYTITRSELTDALGEIASVGSQQLMQHYIRSLEETEI